MEIYRKIGKKYSELFAGRNQGARYKLILVPADFPTVAEANGYLYHFYAIGANVTDNDPSKTNTGQSFVAGQVIFWDVPTQTYAVLTDMSNWIDDGASLKPLNPRNVDADTGNLIGQGLRAKLLNVLGGIVQTDAAGNFSSSTDLPDGTTATTQALGDSSTLVATTEFVANAVPAIHAPEIFTPTPGQTVFTLAETPISADALNVFINGQLVIDYTLVGNTITWLEPDGFVLSPADKVIAVYIVPGIVGASGTYTSTDIINLSGVTGANVTEALDELNLKYKSHFIAGNTVNILGSRHIRGVTASGNFNFNWMIPLDFTEFGADGGVYVLAIPDAGAAGVDRDIDIDIEYDNGRDTNRQAHIAGDNTTLYDLTGLADCVWWLPFKDLITATIVPGMTGGIRVKHNAVGGDIRYLGTLTVYR